MDPKEFERLFGVKDPSAQSTGETQQVPRAGKTEPLQSVTATPSLAEAVQAVSEDGGQSFIQRLYQEVTGDHPEPVEGRDYGTAPDAGTASALGQVYGDSLQDASELPRSMAGGAMKGVFETKDFLFGDTPREQQSAFRQGIEQEVDELRQSSPIINGLAAGIGQFGIAMFGLGKVGMLAKALPWVGEGVAAMEGIKGGSMALEVGKAATAGAIAFDPYEERLSNLIQDTPLANPISEWLAAEPGDSAAWGRTANALESIGMDLAIIGTLKAAGTVWKYLKAGDTAAASRAVSEFELEQRSAIAAEQEHPAASADKVDDLAAQPETPTVEGKPGEAPPKDVSPQSELGPKPEEPAAPEPKSADNAPISDFKPEDIAEAKLPASGIGPATRPGLMDMLHFSLENAEKDWKALSDHGSWQEAHFTGQRQSPDLGAFYDNFHSDRDVFDMMEVAVTQKAEELEAAGFRVRQSDDEFQRQVMLFANLAETDPAQLIGMLSQAAKDSAQLPAKMVVYGSLTAKAFQDASTLAQRLKYGDFTQFGSKEAMEAAIAKRFTLATTMLKETADLRSSAGRQLRALRGKPFDPTMFEGLGKDRFYDLLAKADGDPTKLKYLRDPSLPSKLLDTVLYLRINSLLSGPTTQVINLLTNGYMAAVRPLERILGAAPAAALGSDTARTLVRENLMQYTYMGTAVWDGFGTALRAFLQNDGVLKPHGTEAFSAAQWEVPGSQGLDGGYFKPWDSVPNLIHNAVSVPLTVAGLPTRALGGVDELVKQIVYRSKLMARAHVEGVEMALEAGLTGNAGNDFVKSYVNTKLRAGFDETGRALDQQALREAEIATFQQDLLPGTLGRKVQTALADDKLKWVKFILPFVKTPTNVIRYGVKMTPPLSMLQEEYRSMLLGKMGREAQAQALGQMTMGGLFMAAAAFVAQDRITGGGPSDQRVKDQLLATGWRPYSIVVHNEDGTKTYIPFNRFDPVALPFGIIADIQDAREVLGDDYESNPEFLKAVSALGISLAKQFTSRTYLLSLNQALEAITDPGKKGERFFGSMAASLIPFSAGTRQLSSDPYLRDARSITDNMLQAIPGLSKTLPPRYNWLGQPVVNRQGLWTDDNGTLVDREVQRLGLLPEGQALSVPGPKLDNRVDLRDVTLTTGENAYEKYQQLAGKPSPRAKSLRDFVADLIRSPTYQNAPDGDADTRGTKMWLLSGRVRRYRTLAGKLIRADKNVRSALMAKQQKVIDHYKHLKQPVTQEQTDSIKNIINAFGAGNGRQ